MWVVDTSCNRATQITCHSLLNEASPMRGQANVYLWCCCCCCFFFLGWEYLCRSQVRERFRLQQKAWKWHTGAMMWKMCIRFCFLLPLQQKIGATHDVVSQVQAPLKRVGIKMGLGLKMWFLLVCFSCTSPCRVHIPLCPICHSLSSIECFIIARVPELV